MSASKATARPWATERDGGVSIITDRDGITVCVMMSEANAALIVRAVNSHDALVAALRKVVSDLGELISQSHGVAGLHLNGDLAPWGELTDDGKYCGWLSLDHARAALALAEQG